MKPAHRHSASVPKQLNADVGVNVREVAAAKAARERADSLLPSLGRHWSPKMDAVRGSTVRSDCSMVVPEMDEFLTAIVTSLRDFADVMLVSEREGEPPDARPMHLAEVEDDGTMWFISRPNAYLLAALDSNPAVTVVAQGGGQFVSVGGIAEVYQFPAKLKAIWKPSFKRWFPNGPEKSDAAAIRVSLVRGARWDTLGNHQHYDAP